MGKIRKFTMGLILGPDGKPSLSDLISLCLAVSFLAVSAYLAIRGVKWEHYDAFCLYSVGPSSALKAATKYINNMRNKKEMT